MSRSISIEQLDGTLEDLRREAQKIEARIAAMKDLRALFFGTDASGGGQPSEPVPTQPVRLAPLKIARKARRATTEEAARRLNTCAECKKTWPRGTGRQKRSCPHCGSDNWNG